MWLALVLLGQKMCLFINEYSNKHPMPRRMAIKIMQNIGTGEHHSLHWFFLFLGSLSFGQSSSFRFNSRITAESKGSVRHNFFISLNSDNAFSISLQCLSSISTFVNIRTYIWSFLSSGIYLRLNDVQFHYRWLDVLPCGNCLQLMLGVAVYAKFTSVSKLWNGVAWVVASL